MAVKSPNNQTARVQSSAFYRSYRPRSFGFTLIEIIVVTGLLSTIGLIAASIFFSALKGGAKAEILKEVKQNGDYAVSTMGSAMRNAREITTLCNNSSQSSIAIVNPNYLTTTFDCVGGQIASNSAFLTSNKLMVSDCSFTCSLQSKGLKKIKIKFTLGQRETGVPVEEEASATFETTVYTRSFSY